MLETASRPAVHRIFLDPVSQVRFLPGGTRIWADSIADSLWSATWELDRLLAEVNSEHRGIESYLIESHLDDLRSTVAKLRHAQKAFREASH